MIFKSFGIFCLFVGSCVVFVFFKQESYPSSSPIWFVESDDPNLTSVLERLEDIKKSNTLVSILVIINYYNINIGILVVINYYIINIGVLVILGIYLGLCVYLALSP